MKYKVLILATFAIIVIIWIFTKKNENYNNIHNILPKVPNDFMYDENKMPISSDSILYYTEKYKTMLDEQLFTMSEQDIFNPQNFNELKSNLQYFLKVYDTALITKEFGQSYENLMTIYDSIIDTFDSFVLNIIDVPEYIGKIDSIFGKIKLILFEMVKNIDKLNKNQIYKNGFDIYTKITHDPFLYEPRGISMSENDEDIMKFRIN